MTIQAFIDVAQRTRTVSLIGRVVSAVGTTIRVSGVDAAIGDYCLLRNAEGGAAIRAEVIGMSGDETVLSPLDPLQGLGKGAQVFVEPARSEVPCGSAMIGRVVDAFGTPLDGLGDFAEDGPSRPVHAAAPNPMDRPPIDTVCATGVRAIDSMLTIGYGQRAGIFAMAGCGKSSLIGMISRHASFDVAVIALIGERGREVREFLEDCLGEEGMRRSVVVVATSDRPAMERARAAHAATAIAEGFRAEGKRVLLLLDSVTRFARALREIGLAAGEPPVRRGYPPSVFAELPRLFERTGADARGSITAFYTVLVEDEEGDDPIGEEVRSILDGHIVLARKLAQQGHYPAIDVLASVSRCFNRVVSPAHQASANQLRGLMSRFNDVEFLVQIGEYQRGNDAETDHALAAMPAVRSFLRQNIADPSPFDATLAGLNMLAEGGA